VAIAKGQLQDAAVSRTSLNCDQSIGFLAKDFVFIKRQVELSPSNGKNAATII
jgi:hypothetical protein